MIAVGVARPSAQGQAITSTATALNHGLGEIAGQRPPGNEGRQRDRHDDGDEDRRHPVGQALHRRLGALRLLHQADDPGQQGVAADAGGATTQQAVAVDRRGEHLVAGGLRHRQALAGQHGFVGRGCAFDDRAINRHRLAGADHEHVARDQRRHRHVDQFGDIANSPLNAGRLRLQFRQRLDRGRGPGLGPRLEDLAQQHQRDDRGRGFEIHVLVVQVPGRDDDAVGPGHAGAQRHQHVHVAGAAADGVEAADVEAPANPELHWRRQQQLQPAREHVVMGIGAEHEGHLRHQRQGKRGGYPEAAQFVMVDGELSGLLFAARVGRGNVGGESGLDHRGNQALDVDIARRVAHVGALGGEVDGRLDTRQLVQLLFDARRTGGTGHAAQRQLDGVAIAGGGILRRVHPDFPFKY
jgi:hypothetical protein